MIGRRLARALAMHHGLSRGTALLGVALGLAACGGSGQSDEARALTMRDSAGISIVESDAAPSAPLLVRDSLPAVDVGGRGDEDPDYQLFRVWDALRRRDGSILVANGGTNELRIYDASGTFVRRIGRRGAGPGEFQRLRWIAVANGDTVLAYDTIGRRLSRFAPTGEYIDGVVLGGANTTRFVYPLGLFDDGRMVAQVGSSSADRNMTGLSRDSVSIVLIGAEGTVQDTITSVIGTERSVKSTESGSGYAMIASTPPYGRATTFGVRDDVIAVATGDTYEVRLLDTSGAVRRIVRRRADPVQVTEDDRLALLDGRTSTDMSPQIRKLVAQQMAATEMPTSMPPYSTILLDTAGRLWIREATHAGEPARWAVYDRDGGLLAELRLPERFRVTDAGTDYVLGILSDEDDLERVQLFRLRSPGGAQ